MPPLGDPPKHCFRVNVLAFCSYPLQIPITVILTCKVSFQIALDAISEHLKFKIFLGGILPRPPKSLCLKCTGYYTFPFCPPLAKTPVWGGGGGGGGGGDMSELNEPKCLV